MEYLSSEGTSKSEIKDRIRRGKQMMGQLHKRSAVRSQNIHIKPFQIYIWKDVAIALLINAIFSANRKIKSFNILKGRK